MSSLNSQNLGVSPTTVTKVPGVVSVLEGYERQRRRFTSSEPTLSSVFMPLYYARGAKNSTFLGPFYLVRVMKTASSTILTQ